MATLPPLPPKVAAYCHSLHLLGCENDFEPCKHVNFLIDFKGPCLNLPGAMLTVQGIIPRVASSTLLICFARRVQNVLGVIVSDR